MVTHNPLHRSQRAALPRWAPASGDAIKAHERIGVADSGRRKPARDVATHSLPRQTVLLASTPKRSTPEATDSRVEGAQGRGPFMGTP